MNRSILPRVKKANSWTTSKCCVIGPSRGVAQFDCIGMTASVGLSRGAVPLSSMASYCGTATGLPPILDFGGRPRLGRVATVVSVPWSKRAGFNRPMDALSCLPPMSRRKCLVCLETTGKGPS